MKFRKEVSFFPFFFFLFYDRNREARDEREPRKRDTYDEGN